VRSSPRGPLVTLHEDAAALAPRQAEGQPAREGRLLHSRHRREALPDLAVEDLARFLRVAVHPDLKPREQHAIGVQAEIDPARRLHPLEAEAGPDQEDESERDLRDHESLAQAVVRGGAGRGTPALLEGGIDLRPRGLERRCEPEDDPGSQGEHQGQTERPAIERVGEHDVRNEVHGRDEDRQQVHHEVRKQDPGRPAEEGEEKALHEELTDEPQPARSRHEADRDLLLAADRSGQEEVGHVRGHDQQHSEAHRQEEAERRTHGRLGPVRALRERHHPVVGLPVGVGVGEGEPAVEGGDHGLRLFDGRAGSQAREVVPSSRVAVLQVALVAHLPTHGERGPEIVGHARPGAAERRRDHPDDREGVTVQVDDPA